MTKEQLELLLRFIHERISGLKDELQGYDPYWYNRRADALKNELFTTITEEQS
jgi:hypothetical protein